MSLSLCPVRIIIETITACRLNCRKSALFHKTIIMRKTTIKITLILGVFIISQACNKEDLLPTQTGQPELAAVAFRSNFTLTELQQIEAALRSRISSIVEHEFFSNSNANGLIPQLNNLQRAIDREDEVLGNQILTEDILPHLAGLYEDGILPEILFQELSNLANGIFNQGTVIDPDGNIYPWKEMDDGKKWLVVNLRYKIPDEPVNNIASWYYPEADYPLYSGNPPYPIYKFPIPYQPEWFGRLYTWEAAQAACAALGGGWHLPSGYDASNQTYGEWDNLTEAYGHWKYGVNFGALRKLYIGGDSGFMEVIGGFRYHTDGKFYSLGSEGYQWSANNVESDMALAYRFYPYQGSVTRVNRFKTSGYSCRCVQE